MNKNTLLKVNIMKSKESIILDALNLDEYERKQIATVLIASTLTPMAIGEAVAICKQIAVDKGDSA